MIGDIKGYCVLKSTEHVVGYAGDLKDLAWPHCLRIIDIAVNNSGFLVLNPAGTALADLQDMNDVYTYFLCDEFAGILTPPGLSLIDKMIYAYGRFPYYTKETRKLVIITSLTNRKLTDEFLFKNK